MIAYLDAPVVLRLVLGEPNKPAEGRRVQTGVASALTEVECLRTLDRLGRLGALTENEVAARRVEVYRLLEAVEVIDIARPILRRASEPFPAPIGTLDAIHLATAIAWRDASETPIVMATHDRALAAAARSVGLAVIGD